MRPRFKIHYAEWQQARINKIIKIFGKDFIKDKSILELGCGYGDIGIALSKMGAKVTFVDGRQEHLDVIKDRHSGQKTLLMDLDGEWDLDDEFDIIIHFGLLYHLTNWKENLLSTFKHSNLVILETEVANSNSPTDEFTLKEKGYDQSLHNLGTRLSAAKLEKFFSEHDINFKRYDDADLNGGMHKYDWKVDENLDLNIKGMAHRRFWVLQK